MPTDRPSLLSRLRLWLAERAFLLAGWLDETAAREALRDALAAFDEEE
jgi:hypothetical protein